MKKTFVFILVFMASYQLRAQTFMNRYISLSLSYGVTGGMDDFSNHSEVTSIGKGFYIQGEYVLSFLRWFDFRVYAGFMNTETDQNDEVYENFGYKTNSRAFLLGGKGRFTIPTTWIEPYCEIGLGASIGSFETINENYRINANGPIAHIPVSMGVVVGPQHNIDIGFLYYLHPEVKQFSGTMAFALKIPVF